MDSPTASKHPGKVFDIPTTPRKIAPPGRTRTSITLFDLALQVIPSRKTQKTEYENRLHQEAIDWSHLLKNKKLIDMAGLKSSKLVVHKSILSQEQLSYIERSKPIKVFAEGYEEFILKAQRYLDEYQQFVEMLEQLVELSRQQVNAATFDLIYNCKYKQPSRDWL